MIQTSSSPGLFTTGQQPGPWATGYVYPNQGMSTGAGPAAGGGASWGSLGAMSMIAGGVMSAIGAYYQAENQKLQLKSQASAADFASRIAGINARNAEADAQFAIEAGRREAALYSLRAAQQRAATTVSLGARGIQAGVGSAAEVQASNEIAKRLDLQAIDTNTLRQSQAIRRQAVNERQQALLGGVSARNLRASARSIQPWAGAAGQLLGTAGQAASIYGTYMTANRNA